MLGALKARQIRTDFSNPFQRDIGLDPIDVRDIHPTGALKCNAQIKGTHLARSIPLLHLGGRVAVGTALLP